MLLSLWGCGQGESLVHHIRRLPRRVGFRRCPACQHGVRPFAVVKADPVGDDALGLEAVGEFVQVDRLVFERAPQPLDLDVVHAAAATVH